MYVCLCKGITDKAIREAVDNGANTFRKVRNTLGVSTQCGKCASFAKEIVADAVVDNSNGFDSGLFYAAG